MIDVENIFFFRLPAFTMVSNIRTSSYLHICKLYTSLSKPFQIEIDTPMLREEYE